MSCTHRTSDQFVVGKDGPAYVWRCTSCGKTGPWEASWRYLGSLECSACGRPDVTAVCCSDACEEKANAGSLAPFFVAGRGWQWYGVSSSNIAAIGYDFDHEVAGVRFHNGTTYDYDLVPPAEVEDMLRADSVGGHFNKIFRARHKGVKRQPAPAASVLPGGAS